MPERWIATALSGRPSLDLVPGRCACGAAAPGVAASAGFDYEYHTARNEFRGLRCPRCAAWFLDPRPREADFPVIYPEEYSAFAMREEGDGGVRLAFRAKAWLERRKIARYLRMTEGTAGDVLDVGCGDALLLDGFARAGMPSSRLVGVELHPVAVARARAKGYQVVEGSFEDVDLGAACYRLIVMNQLIEHLVDPRAALAKLRTLLAPGGCVFLETPNLASPNARLAPRRFWGGYHYPRHFHLFTPAALHALLAEAGLAVRQTRYLPCPVQWIVTINSFLQERRHPPRWLLRVTDWRNPLLLAVFTALDLALLPLGTANMQVVATRPRA